MLNILSSLVKLLMKRSSGSKNISPMHKKFYTMNYSFFFSGILFQGNAKV
jgi:hypothetical protein